MSAGVRRVKQRLAEVGRGQKIIERPVEVSGKLPVIRRSYSSG